MVSQCGVEWSGVEWSGVEWIGVEWIGVEWSGLEWSAEGKGRYPSKQRETDTKRSGIALKAGASLR